MLFKRGTACRRLPSRWQQRSLHCDWWERSSDLDFTFRHKTKASRHSTRTALQKTGRKPRIYTPIIDWTTATIFQGSSSPCRSRSPASILEFWPNKHLKDARLPWNLLPKNNSNQVAIVHELALATQGRWNYSWSMSMSSIDEGLPIAYFLLTRFSCSFWQNRPTGQHIACPGCQWHAKLSMRF